LIQSVVPWLENLFNNYLEKEHKNIQYILLIITFDANLMLLKNNGRQLQYDYVFLKYYNRNIILFRNYVILKIFLKNIFKN